MSDETKIDDGKFETFVELFKGLGRQFDELNKSMALLTEKLDEVIEVLDDVGDVAGNGVLPACEDLALRLTAVTQQMGAANANPFNAVKGFLGALPTPEEKQGRRRR